MVRNHALNLLKKRKKANELIGFLKTHRNRIYSSKKIFWGKNETFRNWGKIKNYVIWR